ncbi:DISARM system phospholipase D-like protein DrmC [Rhodococcus opacus]|uniref:DISARM system phospholipase D-like protein DrmC n=1 Tax=Rhodococcus opacus TaxID=37919 RepID=UPI0024768238|nr:DISARM system phospholipase D-like protein DrmC [Rhodococcus opacus]MDH6291898.1 cardiolipin synthase [Rhodococcus opacus]
MTDEEIQQLVDVATALPFGDLDKLATAARNGPQSLRDLRSRSAGALREACTTVMRTMDRASLPEISGVLRGAAAAGRTDRDRVDLVWTGPDVPGSVSRLTSAVVADLVDQAQNEVLLISYAMHSEPTLTEALTRAVNRGVFVQILCERSVDNPAFNAGRVPFPGLKVRRLCWPMDKRPAGASMHAKALVIDRKIALVGSANITGTAMLRNLECGVLLHDKQIAAEIAESIDGLLSRDTLQDYHG